MPNAEQKETKKSNVPLKTLVQRAKSGDREAFGRLIAFYKDDVFRMVFFRTPSRLDAEDLTQETFMRAFKNIRQLERADRFRSWLLSIALNRVRDFHRKQRLRSLFSRSADQNGSVESKIERSGEPDSLQSLIKKDFWNQVGSFLKKLSAMEREVFMLRFMDHLTIREVSEVMKKNESTVKTHLYRSLQKFRREDALRHFLQESLL